MEGLGQLGEGLDEGDSRKIAKLLSEEGCRRVEGVNEVAGKAPY